MSLFSKVVSGLRTVARSIVPTIAGAVLGGTGGAVAQSAAAAGAQMGRVPMIEPPATTAGSAAGGVVQTLPQLARTGAVTGPGVPTPGGLMSQLGQLGGQFLRAGAQGMGLLPAGRGAGGAHATKVGRLTGNLIPRGYVERMSPSGVIYLARQRRRHGISNRDIRSFYRVHRLVAKIHGRESRMGSRRRK